MTLTAWVGADDHLIHRIRSEEPGDGDTPASTAVMDFTGFGEPVDLHRPDPSSVIGYDDLDGLLDAPEDIPTAPYATGMDLDAYGIPPEILTGPFIVEDGFTGSLDLGITLYRTEIARLQPATETTP
ncbi:MAG: hypothetical protein R3C15_20835 [Thermoleophilia bacterium]